MRLTISVIPHFKYSTEIHEFPIDVALYSEIEEEVISKADVVCALLTNIANPNVFFGYVRRVTPAKLEARIVRIDNPILMRVNIFEHDDDFSDYSPGDYRCEVKVELYEMIDGHRRIVELKDEIVIPVR